MIFTGQDHLPPCCLPAAVVPPSLGLYRNLDGGRGGGEVIIQSCHSVLFIYLAASGLSSSMRDLPRCSGLSGCRAQASSLYWGTWDLGSPTRDPAHVLCIASWILNHVPVTEGPCLHVFNLIVTTKHYWQWFMKVLVFSNPQCLLSTPKNQRTGQEPTDP